MNFVGVDGCRAGWFWVSLMRSGEWQADIEQSFSRVWSKWQEAHSILVDIPIGLRNSSHDERLCDREARRVLGPPRSSSVFLVPCRPSLYARGYREACRINERYTGRRLSRQSWNIARKTREVDELLQSHPRARRGVREIHPEVLFWALNGGESMKYNKRTKDGFKERLHLLEIRYPGSQVIVASVLSRFTTKQVGKDDVLDALVGAVTGELGWHSLKSFPEQPERDSTGLPMEIAYFAI